MSAVQKYGVPEIINSDQGSLFTSKDWMDMCSMFPDMKVSMDGRGRAKDNIWIEKFWKTIKYEYIYLTPAETVIELREGIAKYMNHYNFQRRHQGIKRVIPYNLYTQSVA